MLGIFKYKTQRSGTAFALNWVGMVVILVSFAILFVSMPPTLYHKPNVSLNSIPAVILAVFVFVFGYWLTSIFPSIKFTDAGIRCKRMYFYMSVKWLEMDNMVELKNGTIALTIKRKGWPLLNGLFFEWLTSKMLRIKDPVILFVPEFFGDDKSIPQEIIANTPATSGVNAYLSEKINGTGFINPSRFSVQETENGVSITIPGKKNILAAIFFIPMALLWSYFAVYAIYFFVLINLGAILSLFQGQWESHTYTAFAFIDIFAFLFISFILLWIWGVFSLTARHMLGKEIIETNGQSLTITRQIFRWKRRNEFPSNLISDLRVGAIKFRLLLAPYQAFQSALGRDGIIVFEFEGKSIRFGLDISEDEGNYILAMLKSRTNM